MRVKTRELTKNALNWAVAECVGLKTKLVAGKLHDSELLELEVDGNTEYDPSNYWTQGGPIIEREGINLFQRKGIAAKEGRPWLAYTSAQLEQEGVTPLIAAMRTFVASKLGDEVEIPDELIDTQQPVERERG
jgi:hypothetical protein